MTIRAIEISVKIAKIKKWHKIVNWFRWVNYTFTVTIFFSKGVKSKFKCLIRPLISSKHWKRSKLLCYYSLLCHYHNVNKQIMSANAQDKNSPSLSTMKNNSNLRQLLNILNKVIKASEASFNIKGDKSFFYFRWVSSARAATNM